MYMANNGCALYSICIHFFFRILSYAVGREKRSAAFNRRETEKTVHGEWKDAKGTLWEDINWMEVTSMEAACAQNILNTNNLNAGEMREKAKMKRSTFVRFICFASEMAGNFS